MNEILYADSEHREHTLAVIECIETVPVADSEPKTTRFKWLSNFTVTDKNIIALANEGGRLRWKIDAKREGFNNQKNGGFELEHPYSQHPIATQSEVFYLLLQIAHVLYQLVEQGTRSGSARLFQPAWARAKTLPSACWKRGATCG